MAQFERRNAPSLVRPVQRRLPRQLLLWLLALTMVAGCQAQLPAWLVPWRVAPEAASTPADTAPAESERPVLRIFAPPGTADENDRLQAVVAAFPPGQPSVVISLTLPADYDSALTTALAANLPPDLFVLDTGRVRDLAATGSLAPLLTAQDGLADFYPVLLAQVTVDGQLVCLPRELRTLGLVYNRDRFDAAGLAYPTAAWGWDDLRRAAETLTDATTATVGLALPPDISRWLPFLYAAGGSVTDEAMTVMTINSAEAATAMSFYVQLVIDGLAATPAELETIWAGEALGKGRAAMAIEGNWAIPYLSEQFPGLNVGVAELPTGAQGQATLAFATCVAVSASSAQLELATQLAAYLTAPATMAALTDSPGAMPARLSLLDGWRQNYPQQDAFVNGLGYARLWRFGPRFNPLITTVNTGLGQAFLNVRSVSDILAQADGVGNGVLAR